LLLDLFVQLVAIFLYEACIDYLNDEAIRTAVVAPTRHGAGVKVLLNPT